LNGFLAIATEAERDGDWSVCPAEGQPMLPLSGLSQLRQRKSPVRHRLVLEREKLLESIVFTG